MKTLICDCNHSMPLDGPGLAAALAKVPGASAEGLQTVHTGLCRREAGAFQRAAKETGAAVEELVVACTQERRLFLELNDATEGSAPVSVRPIHFVNLRETGGWSRDAQAATPKMAALLAAAQLPAPDPVPTVTYRSGGRCLVIGSAEAAERAAAMLADRLDVSLLVEGTGGALPQSRERAVHAGRLQTLTGWLGAFDVSWRSDNPIDLDLCTRCNACVAACPEGAIGMDWQVNLDLCRGHRDCVRVCEAAGAIDFQREPTVTEERFDLVLDLRASPAFSQHQPPQGYRHAGSDPQALIEAVLALRELSGEFEKPRFFQYDAKLCAHSRNEQIGCHACIDVCSTRAIRSDASRKGKAGSAPRRRGPESAGVHIEGGGVIVEPHLCVGCGACSTVCPSGAMSFAYPRPDYQGKRLRTMLRAYAAAGGRDAALLLHSEQGGRRLLDDLGRAARTDRGTHGVPARVLPVPLWHTASVGVEMWLSALAWGARQVWVLLTAEEAPEYREALAAQMAVAQAIVHGLGYQGEHFKLIEARDARDLAALDAALRAPTATGPAVAATHGVVGDKRNVLDMALDHLLAHAPAAATVGAAEAPAIALPAAGSPLGTITVDTQRCTLCLSCVGACPEGALLDNPEKPQLRFLERNCVQCGLCASTCPENAISLTPRLWLADAGRARRDPRVLNEAQPWRCIKCSKPFGTQRAIETMLGKLAGHPAFQGAAAERLKMCGDCRVIDLHTNPNEVRITDL